MRPGDEIAELERKDESARDGIGEEDHAIPFWFNAAFGATIVFALTYMAYYVGSDWSQRKQYEAEVAKAQAIARQIQAARPTVNPYRGNAAAIAEGSQVFATICAACHKPDGTGLVGPSLVDPYWKYGHEDADLFATVSGGRPGGMPAWATQLGDEKIWKVLAYLETLPKQSAPGLGSPDFAPPAPAAAPSAGGS
ncbi:MAG TPA: c-type cytochrome [Myxococcota bacterium]|nr:c-type cytochrome [Myxococcota bacterium]